MIFYNISIIIEDSRHQQVIDWVKGYLRGTRYETKLLKMLDSPHDGSTYCVHYTAANEQELARFQQEVVSALQAYIGQQHAEKAFLFDSKMQYLTID